MKKLLSVILIANLSVNALAFEPAQTQRPLSHQNDYNHLIAPLAAMVIGFQQGGKEGAALGFIIGCVDEGLTHYGWTDRHYLTAGILGAGATSAIDWRWARYLGFAGGSLLATGKLNPIIEKAGLPLSTALVAASQGGLTGAAIGAVCGITDEGLMWFEVTDKPYLSNLVYGITAISGYAPHLNKLASHIPLLRALARVLSTSSLPLKQILGVAAGSMLSMGASTYNSTSPIQLKNDLHEVLSRILDQKPLNDLMEKQGIVLVTTQLVLAALGLKLTKHFQDTNTNFAYLGNLANHADNNHADFNKALLGLVIFFPMNFAIQTGSEFVNSMLSARTSRQVKDAIFEKFASNETALRLSSDPLSAVLVEKMDEYLDTVLKGGEVLGSALGSATNSVFYISFLHKENALDLIVILDVYNQVISFANIRIADLITKYEHSQAQATSREQNLVRDILKKSNLLIPGDKMELVKAKVHDARQEKRAIDDRMLALESVQNTYMTMTSVLSFIAQNYLVANKIVNREIAFANSGAAQAAVESVSSAMSWQAQNAKRVQRIGMSIDNLHGLLDKLEEEKSPELIPTYGLGASDHIGVRFDNVTVGVANTTLVQVPELYLERGIYAVSGAQGSGKSAFLSKVKGVEGNQFWAQGGITYLTKDGQMPRRMLATQECYFAPYSTLLEVIMSKPMKEINVEGIMPRVMELLKEIGFDTTGDDAKVERWLLEEQADWSKLSGGQRKTVSIVSAILAKPELLILDEVFANMDPNALANAQRLIKRELAESLIFVVDHHAEGNNLNSFYKKELNFTDAQIRVKDVGVAK